MHHGKDEDPFGLNGVKDSEREPVHQATSDLTSEHPPGLWEVEGSVDRRVDLELKLLSETALAGLVVLESVLEFLVCFGVEREGH